MESCQEKVLMRWVCEKWVDLEILKHLEQISCIGHIEEVLKWKCQSCSIFSWIKAGAEECRGCSVRQRGGRCSQRWPGSAHHVVFKSKDGGHWSVDLWEKTLKFQDVLWCFCKKMPRPQSSCCIYELHNCWAREDSVSFQPISLSSDSPLWNCPKDLEANPGKCHCARL